MRAAPCGLLAALVLSTPVAAQQGSTPPATQSTLRIELLPYDDSDASLNQLQQVITVLPPRQVTLAANGTISALVLAEFGFGPSDLPRTYALIEQRILALNRITAPEQAKPGTFLIPVLPSNVRYNPAFAWNEFPSAAEFRIGPRIRGIDMASARAEDVVVERVTDTRRRGAIGMTFDLPLTMNLLSDPSIAALARTSFASLPSEPLRVKFGGQNCLSASPPPVLSARQRGELEALLRDARRTVPLFVIDTGWPSVDSQRESWEYLRSMLQRLRQQFHLGASPNLPLPQYEEPGVPHCKAIEKALEEFRSISRDRVKVVYVPMAKEQGATPLLSEMIEVADAVRRITNRFGPNRPLSVPPEILDSARKFAAEVIPRLKPRITGGITETDKAVLESVVTLASEAARIDQTFHVVNESWAVATGVVRYDPPSNPMGLVVAAAGNDGININLKELDFAHRSSSGGGFVAVMNVDANGDPTCGSSSIDLSVINSSNAIGFSGAIPGDSATSYAAPRVGWLLAAAEAVRQRPVAPGLWPGQVQDRMKATRSGTTPPSLRMLLGDPVKLVRLWLD